MKYVISDIHGHFNEFKKMLKEINFSDEDELFILGDVIDKGKNSIGALLYIMKHKNMHMCLGNHEHMMFSYLSYEYEENMFDTYRPGVWRDLNHGSKTLKEFDKLTYEEKVKVFNFIKNLPLNFPDVEANGKHYYLCHSIPVFRDTDETFTMKDVGYDLRNVERFIWEKNYGFEKIEGKTIIFGHKIQENLCINKFENSYAIDCGAAWKDHLGCLRLDDLKEFYIRPEIKNYEERYNRLLNKATELIMKENEFSKEEAETYLKEADFENRCKFFLNEYESASSKGLIRQLKIDHGEEVIPWGFF